MALPNASPEIALSRNRLLPALEFSNRQLLAILFGTIFDIIGAFITTQWERQLHVLYFDKSESNPPILKTAGVTLASETNDRGLKIGNIRHVIPQVFPLIFYKVA
jgi:hypothetical protein